MKFIFNLFIVNPIFADQIEQNDPVNGANVKRLSQPDS